MRVGVLQFDPQIRKVQENQTRADELLANVVADDLDLLVLPELAFTGYNFASLSDIRQFLEPTASGVTAKWARATASRLNCVVSVGYPEICHHDDDLRNSEGSLEIVTQGASCDLLSDEEVKDPGSSKWRTYNSILTVGPSGNLLAHYRKTNLYYTDVTWSWPNPDGLGDSAIDLPVRLFSPEGERPGKDQDTTPTTFGICMDFNPLHFSAPFDDYELAMHMKKVNSRLLIASNAWSTHKTRDELAEDPDEYDSDTLTYWLLRLRPLLGVGGGWQHTIDEASAEAANASGPGIEPSEPDESGPFDRSSSSRRDAERIIIIANRIGIEPGAIKAYDLTRGHPPPVAEPTPLEEAEASKSENMTATRIDGAEPAASNRDMGSGSIAEVAPEARYAGTSCVFGLRGDNCFRMYGYLGRAQEKLLLVDTEGPSWIGGISLNSTE